MHPSIHPSAHAETAAVNAIAEISAASGFVSNQSEQDQERKEAVGNDDDGEEEEEEDDVSYEKARGGVCGVVPFVFHFSESDIVRYVGRIKHSMYLMDFCKGMVLGAMGNTVQATSYEDVIMMLSHAHEAQEAHGQSQSQSPSYRPMGYWPLHHSVGTHLAMNKGTWIEMDGRMGGNEQGREGWVNRWMDAETSRALQNI